MTSKPLNLFPATHQNLASLVPRVAFHGTRQIERILKRDSISPARGTNGGIMFSHCPDRALAQAFGGARRFGDGPPMLLAVCWDGIVEEFTPRTYDPKAELSLGGPRSELWVHQPVAELYRFLIGVLRLEKVGGNSPLVVATPFDGARQSVPR